MTFSVQTKSLRIQLNYVRHIFFYLGRNSLKELQKAIEETKKEDAFDTFELASHTFGVANILNHLSLLDEYFRLLLLTLQDE